MGRTTRAEAVGRNLVEHAFRLLTGAASPRRGTIKYNSTCLYGSRAGPGGEGATMFFVAEAKKVREGSYTLEANCRNGHTSFQKWATPATNMPGPTAEFDLHERVRGSTRK